MINTGNSNVGTAGWYSRRIDCLRNFMMEERAARLEATLARRTRYMTICMENTFHPQNASALVRHCDAFGLQDIHTIEEACSFRPNVNIVKGTDRWVTFHRHGSTAEALGAMRAAGYRIVATTPHAGDRTPENFDVGAGPFALVFGTEHAGISDRVGKEADEFLRIPMEGFVESLNVSASAAILIYMLSRKVREEVDGWELGEQESLPILYDWMKKTLKDPKGILRRSGFEDI